ncbi:MAG: class I SAM-dependent methyltransferase [Candidatus Paceibacteria bacterium]
MYSTEFPKFIAPEVVASHFHVREGDMIADFGAGSGYFTPVFALATGPTGRVLACEIQKSLVEKIGCVARQCGHSNVDVLWCDIEEERGIPLNDDILDAGGLINTFFQIEDKATAVREIHRVIRPGGVIHVIEWNDSYAGIGPSLEQVVDKEALCDWFESDLFMLEREYPAGAHHYGLTFRVV